MRTSLCFALLVVAGFVGCSQQGVKVESIEVKASNDPLFEPRNILKQYAEGKPLGSEVTSFDYHVKKVREADPARADVLEAGFKALQEVPPGQRASKAKELLEKIKPSMT